MGQQRDRDENTIDLVGKELIAYLYEKYHEAAHRVIIRRLGNRLSKGEREDLIQDVFIKLLSHTETLENSSSSDQFAYIYSALYHRAVDESDRLEADKTVSLDEITDYEEWALFEACEITPESLYLEKEDWNETSQRLHRVLNCLSKRDYNLLTAKYFDGLNDRQISRKFGISETVIRVSLSRARKKAAKLYKAELEKEHKKYH